MLSNVLRFERPINTVGHCYAQDSQGMISALIDKSQNILATEQKAKATILKKTISICFFFPQLSPLRLGQICIEKVQEMFEIAPENLRFKYPITSDIIIDSNGILKLLANLKDQMTKF